MDNNGNNMRKTKIICTIGPTSEDDKTFGELVESGMNVARLNLSHGDYQEHKKRIDTVRRFNERHNHPVAILLDMKGPEIRTGELDEKLNLKKGDLITLTNKKEDKDKLYVNYEDLAKDTDLGKNILIDDGLICLCVESKTDTDVVCRVMNDGILGSKKSVNLPGIDVNLPSFTEKDWDDVKFGIENDVDYIAVSFVRYKDDIVTLRDFLEKNGSKIKIISKIEHSLAIDNFDGILAESDAIMVARGDLGVEIPFEKVPIHQYDIVKKCNHARKPVITATQMLNSMIDNPRPTRAEVTDVLNAILIGSDAIMLSGETASGDYPVEAVKVMDKVATESEKKIRSRLNQEIDKDDVSHIICYSAVMAASKLDAKAVVAFTETGSTPRQISQFRPRMPIHAMTPSKEVMEDLAMVWGVYPHKFEQQEDVKRMILNAVDRLKSSGYVEVGDKIVMVFGYHMGRSGMTNMAEIYTVE